MPLLGKEELPVPPQWLNSCVRTDTIPVPQTLWFTTLLHFLFYSPLFLIQGVKWIDGGHSHSPSAWNINLNHSHWWTRQNKWVGSGSCMQHNAVLANSPDGRPASIFQGCTYKDQCWIRNCMIKLQDNVNGYLEAVSLLAPMMVWMGICFPCLSCLAMSMQVQNAWAFSLTYTISLGPDQREYTHPECSPMLIASSASMQF